MKDPPEEIQIHIKPGQSRVFFAALSVILLLATSCGIFSVSCMQWTLDMDTLGSEGTVRYKQCEGVEARVGSLVSEKGIRDTANFIFVEDQIATKEASEFLPSVFLPLMKRYKLEPGCEVEARHLPTVYVETALIASFSRFSRQIPFPYVLLSGESDISVPQGIGRAFTDWILNSSKLIWWYAQNLNTNGEHATKLRHMPIGLDYHSMEGTKTRIEQEKELLEITRSSKLLKHRQVKIYSSFHSNLPDAWHGSDREEAYRGIAKELITHEPSRVSRHNTWQQQSEYAFVASPHGRGLDTHRTWEALMLGCIVVVKTSSLDPLYEGLPVVIVNRWSDVSKDLLDKSVEKFSLLQDKHKTVDEFVRSLSHLQLKHWRSEVSAAQASKVESDTPSLRH